MSLTTDGIWKVGVWATTVWADGVWREGTPTPPIPPAPTGEANSGGYFRGSRQRTDEDVRRGRQAVGLLPSDVAAIVVDVAAEAAEQDYSQEIAVHELETELTAIRVDLKAAYVDALRQQIGALREELAAEQQRQEMELIAVFAIALDH